MINVAVLGANGMLGSMIVNVLRHKHNINLLVSTRSHAAWKPFSKVIQYRQIPCVAITVEIADNLLDALIGNADWVINCIGVTKPRLQSHNLRDYQTAAEVNSIFPYKLARSAERCGFKVIQIATDCVFSGLLGNYTELMLPDASDIYGLSKSLGEVYNSEYFYNLRCSIIGPEPFGRTNFLFSKLLSEPTGAAWDGYTSHLWNGLTTYHFAKLCAGFILSKVPIHLESNIQHIVPTGSLTKCELLQEIVATFHRTDISIYPVDQSPTVNRTLATNHPAINNLLWESCGYDHPPTIPEMLRELRDFNYAFSGKAK